MTYPTGPRIDRDTYERSQRSGKAAKRLSPEIKAIRRRIAEVRRVRHAMNRAPFDLLIAASRTRRSRLERLREERREKAFRDTLLAAAREARKMGFHVRGSKGRDGRISSYYCQRRDEYGPALRISDHDIPQNDRRDFMAAAHGRFSYDGYPGPEIIIDRPRRAEWLRRAIVLAAHGRM